MNIHSKRSELTEKKKFSFKAHGITSYHAAPAVLMVVAGLALSAIISDVPPSLNQAFASSVEEQVEESGNHGAGLDSIMTGLVTGPQTEIITNEQPQADSFTTEISFEKPDILAAGLNELRKEEVERETVVFSSFTSSITETEAAEKLEEIQKADRERELWEASGEAVASSNRNLYLDTYWYQRGPSNIPSTGLYTSCVPGQVISQMQPPESLTFDENGVPENYLYCIEGKSTAYYGGYMTATGSATRPGVVAVDPREIPYGTEMWIVSSDGRYVYGFARAEDTGGFIYWPKGATVDLYMNTYADCAVWGWRGVKIYILPTSYK